MNAFRCSRSYGFHGIDGGVIRRRSLRESVAANNTDSCALRRRLIQPLEAFVF